MMNRCIVLLCFLIILFFEVGFATPFPLELKIQTGAENIAAYLQKLRDKRVGILCNHTTIFPNKTHLVDSLLSLGINITLIFAPEHGFRGDLDAGEIVNNTVDKKTGIHIVSLYGSKKGPSKKDLEKIDILLFDIQDVGVRFYTYISSLEYAMQACIKHNIPFILLDRPNPNGHYIDGPVLQLHFKSFIGMQSIPVVYGMTIGEYGLMLKGEKWIDVSDKALKAFNLEVIPCSNYRHDAVYKLPIPPSPNLQSYQSVLLYPSLAFFEGTPISVGRGTPFPYEVFGHPSFSKKKYPFTFTPKSNKGNKHPMYNGQKVYGKKIERRPSRYKLELSFVLNTFKNCKDQISFFTVVDKEGIPFFDKLAGNSQLRKEIQAGLSEKQIRASWKHDIKQFKRIREKYLLYP